MDRDTLSKSAQYQTVRQRTMQTWVVFNHHTGLKGNFYTDPTQVFVSQSNRCVPRPEHQPPLRFDSIL